MDFKIIITLLLLITVLIAGYFEYTSDATDASHTNSVPPELILQSAPESDVAIAIPNEITGVIYQEPCDDNVTKTRICAVNIISKSSDHALARVRYQYVKGKEDKNRFFILANKGRFDNTIGVRRAYVLKQGDHTIDVTFGLFRKGEYTKHRPYISEQLEVEIRGIDEKKNIYIRPSIVKLLIKYQQAWYN